MTYDVRLKIYTDFTRDQDQILDAISQAVASKKEPDRGAGSSEEPLRPSADSPSLLLNLPAGEDLARESRVFEETIALLGRAAEGIVGRKNLMLFSIGFGETDSNGIWAKDVRYYPAMERNLNDGNVAVYAIDLLGGRGGQGGVGMASSLSSIAGDTAGRYFDSFTNFRDSDQGSGEGDGGLLPAVVSLRVSARHLRLPGGESGHAAEELRGARSEGLSVRRHSRSGGGKPHAERADRRPRLRGFSAATRPALRWRSTVRSPA